MSNLAVCLVQFSFAADLTITDTYKHTGAAQYCKVLLLMRSTGAQWQLGHVIETLGLDT